MKKIGLSLFLLFCASFLYAQVEATTTDGKKVILNSDGTWKYAEATAPKATTSTGEITCEDVVSSETDKMTGKTSLGSKEAIIVSDDGKNGIGVYMVKLQKTIVLNLTAVGASSCIDATNQTLILFRDDTRIEMTNNAKFNCDSKFTLYFGGTFGKKKELESLMSKEIATMRVYTKKGYVEKDFTPEQSQKVMQTFKCLSEAK